MNYKVMVLLLILVFTTPSFYANDDNQIKSIQINLSKKEKIWIQNNPVIRIGNLKSFPPYGFIQENEHKGFNIEYIQALAKLTGLKVEFVLVQSLKDLQKKLKKKEIDVVAGFGSYLNGFKSVILTEPFLTSFDSIITKKENPFLANYKHLYGKKVAIVKGYDYENIIEKFYPQIEVKRVKNTLEGLKKVDQGEVDALIANNDVSLYLFNQYAFSNLRLGVPANFPNVEIGETLNFAIREDWQELQTILEKSIKGYSNKKLLKLEKKWLDPRKNTKSSVIEFTPEEKEWIASNIVKVGGQMDWMPFDFVNNQGQHRGVSHDILRLISKKSGLQFEYVTGKTWHELLESFSSNEIDILPSFYLTQERAEYAYFTRPYMKIRNYVFMKRNRPDITSINEIKDKKIVYVDGYNALDKILKKFPNIELVKVNTIEEALESIMKEKADFYVEDYPVVMFHLTENMQREIKPVLAVPHDQKNLHMGINKNQKMLIQIFSKIESTLTYSDINTILTKWLYNNEISNDIIFTKRELEWLSRNKELTYSEIDWKPLTIIEKNKMKGIIAEYLNIVQQYTGIKFVYKRAYTWSEVLEKFKDNEIDFIPGIGEYAKNFEAGIMSDKYLEYPMVIITKDDITYVKSLEEIKDKTFSVPKYYTSYNYLKRYDPNIKIIETKGIKEALLNVSNAQADAYIGHLLPSLYYLRQTGRKNLSIAGNTKFNYKHHFLISQKHPEFASIVNKVLERVTKKQKDDIYHKWVKTEVKSTFDYSILWKFAIVFLLIVIVIVYYSRKMKQQKVFFETLINSQEQMVITTDGNRIFNANKRFLEFFDVASEKIFRDKIGSCISDTFDKYAPKNYLQKYINDMIWIEYVLKYPNTTHKIRILKKNRFYIFSVTASLLPTQQELMSAVFTDITQIETAKNDVENIISSMLLPVIITSVKEESVLYLNEHAQSVLKVDSKKALGQNIDNILYFEGGKAKLDDFLEQKGFIKNHEIEIYLTEDETKFSALLSVSKINYRGQDAYLGMFADITKIKEMEMQIRQNHKQVKDSIEYASLIQETFIPHSNLFAHFFSDYFIIWEPKDIVGGDIYLFETLNENECVLMVIDCTGHGVPGAFVTMLVKAVERQILYMLKKEFSNEISPSQILTIFNQNMKHLLKQNSQDVIANAGFDGGIIYYNKQTGVLKFAGAETSLFYTKENEIIKVKGDRHSIGYKKSDEGYCFKEHAINVAHGMQFYISTDGFIDQNGGKKGFSFGKRKFTKMIETNMNQSFNEQKKSYLSTLKEYQGHYERNDDITFIGFKL